MGQPAAEAVRPALDDPYPAYTFQEPNSSIQGVNEPSTVEFNYTTRLETFEGQRGNDYLLNEGNGTTSGEFLSNLEFPTLRSFDVEDYSPEGSRFLPPVLYSTGFTTGALSYDFLNEPLLPLGSSSTDGYASYGNPQSEADYSWTYVPDTEELDDLGLGVIDNGTIYSPNLFEPIPSSSSTSKNNASPLESAVTFTPQTTSTSLISSSNPNSIPSPSGPIFNSMGTTIANPYAVLAALASITPKLATSAQSTSSSSSGSKTRPLSLLKQPSTLKFPSNVTSPNRIVRSNSQSQNSQNRQGLYSSSGFDLVGMLARVASRPNAQINIGPVDTKSAFVVCDANQYDQPIIFASETFKELTGYSGTEILGQNCRFLQSPDGVIIPGSTRQYMDGRASFHLKRHISAGKESQTSMINYCKGGKPFINLLTVIPITWDSDEIAFYVGFQVSLAPSAPSRFQRLP